MAKRIFPLLAFLALSALTARADESLPLGRPSFFQVYVGGFIGTSDDVRLEADGLHYEAREGGAIKRSVVAHPDSRAWSKFMKALNEARLYRWAADYPNGSVCDGTQWKVALRIGDRSIESRGSNNYPKDGDESKSTNDATTPSHSFEVFCSAVSGLVRKPFQ